MNKILVRVASLLPMRMGKYLLKWGGKNRYKY